MFGCSQVWLGREEGALLGGEAPVPVSPPHPHAAPPRPQVVAIDLDEGPNGLVSYRMPVGMPRMDFLINSSSGAVVTTTELDRERIAEYQLRVVASDAGTPTKSSTSTLTIHGEGRGGLIPNSYFSCYYTFPQMPWVHFSKTLFREPGS